MLNIYINTWGNYNENGADGGEWITLPMDEDELEETLERVAEQMGDNDPEWFVNDYEWTTEYSIRGIGEHENYFDLNEYVQELDNLDEDEQKVYMAAVEIFGSQVEPCDVDEYRLMEDIESEYDLGYYWAHDSGCYNLDDMGTLANYIDYGGFGRDISIESDGGFSSYGWIEKC
jgi:antirestriction protein